LKYLSLIIIFLLYISCNQSPQPDKTLDPAEIEKILPHSYTSTNIPGFIRSYVDAHWLHFKNKDSTSFHLFCTTNKINPKDSLNARRFYTIDIIHRLLTAKGPVNGSVGEIIKIPYYWHWVTPNPRHTILQAANNTPLKNIQTLSIFPNYSCFADIDRTPYLFLTDLFGKYPAYKSALCDSFSSFGWCSEREMSFIALMQILGLEGKQVSENNHSWSVLRVNMLNDALQETTFKVIVDNTYDKVTWSLFTEDDSKQWNRYYGNVPLAKWYNAQAHSAKEIARLSGFIIDTSAINYIETSTINYLQKKP